MHLTESGSWGQARWSLSLCMANTLQQFSSQLCGGWRADPLTSLLFGRQRIGLPVMFRVPHLMLIDAWGNPGHLHSITCVVKDTESF